MPKTKNQSCEECPPEMECDDPIRPCSDCGETIGHGARQYTCEICGDECCTVCSYDGADGGVVCEDCHEEPATTPNGERVRQHPLVLPSFRVLLSRLDEMMTWSIVANPSWNHFTQAQSAILENDFNEYSEYLNCGVIHRMIRAEDWLKYGTGKLARAWVLDPRQNAKGHTPAE